VKNLISKPYILFWGFIPTLFAIEYYKGFSFTDYSTNNTTEIILRFELTGFFAVFIGIIGIIYWILIEHRSFLLSFGLNMIHLSLTIGSIILLQNQIGFDFFSLDNETNHKEIDYLFIVIFLGQILKFNKTITYCIIQ